MRDEAWKRVYSARVDGQGCILDVLDVLCRTTLQHLAVNQIRRYGKKEETKLKMMPRQEHD